MAGPGLIAFETYGSLESYLRLANADASSIPKSAAESEVTGTPKSGKEPLEGCAGTIPEPRRELNIPKPELGIGGGGRALEAVLRYGGKSGTA
jgi:hypothetical protein